MIERRGTPLLTPRLEHARGVRLIKPVDFERAKDGRDTRHQHYLADIISNLCYRRHGNKFPRGSHVSQLFEKGVYDLHDNRLDALLRATRELERDNRSAALLELASMNFHDTLSRRSAATLLLQRFAKMVRDDLAGDDFLLLARDIKTEDVSRIKPASTPAEQGIIQWFNTTEEFGYVRAATDRCFFGINAWKSATYPLQGQLVEFIRSRPGDGRKRATWIRALA
jgi:cold shock CspA family protein